MGKPSKLDRLYRFFQHEDPEISPGCMWNLAAGSLERKARLYRVIYQDSETRIESEQTIHVKYPRDLEGFYKLLQEILERDDIDISLQKACKILIEEDPWLSMWLTGTLPSLGTDDVSSSSGSTEHDASLPDRS
jgi:hypothetical protein